MEGSSLSLPLADPWQHWWKPGRALAGQLKKHRVSMTGVWGDTGPHQSRRAKDPPVTTCVDPRPKTQPNLHSSKQPSGPTSPELCLSLGL